MLPVLATEALLVKGLSITAVAHSQGRLDVAEVVPLVVVHNEAIGANAGCGTVLVFGALVANKDSIKGSLHFWMFLEQDGP